jgi:hypothetical protein
MSLQLDFAKDAVDTEPDAAPDTLQQLTETTHDLIGEIRSIVNTFGPPPSTSSGWPAQSERRLLCTAARHPVACEMTVIGDLGQLPAPSKLPPTPLPST